MRPWQVSADREGVGEIGADDVDCYVILTLFQDDGTEKFTVRLNPYFPVQFPGRFSTNADMPSF